MKEINSRQNSEIKEISRLKLSKQRNLQRLFLAEGNRTCKTLIESGITLNKLYITQKMLSLAKKLVVEEKITLVSNSVMEKISSSTTPSGLLGLFAIPKTPKTADLGRGIVLSHITNPGNMGTLIRTCAAMGFKTVVVIEGTDPWSPKVIQSSAGEIAKVDIFKWSWQQLLRNKKQLNLIALVVSDGQPPKNINFNNSLLVIGSEAHGIPNEWIKDCNTKLTLPMPGKTESLNASIAGSIAMYLARKI